MIRQTLRAIRRRIKGEHYHEIGPGTELPSAWYDWAYGETPAYHAHYSDSGYYFLWSVIVDRMLRAGVRQVLDLGCGPGQVAALLYDKGMREYRGLDSARRRSRSRRAAACPALSSRSATCHKGTSPTSPTIVW